MNTSATACIHKEEAEHVPAMAAAWAVIIAAGKIINSVPSVAAAEVVNQHPVRQAAVLLPVHQAAVHQAAAQARQAVLVHVQVAE